MGNAPVGAGYMSRESPVARVKPGKAPCRATHARVLIWDDHDRNVRKCGAYLVGSAGDRFGRTAEDSPGASRSGDRRFRGSRSLGRGREPFSPRSGLKGEIGRRSYGHRD